MVVPQVLFLIKPEVVKGTLKHLAHRAGRPLLERDEGVTACVCDRLEVLERAIHLVGADLADLEVTTRLIHQRDKRGRVRGILPEDPNRRDDVRLDPARDMELDPGTFRSGDAVLLVVPPFVPARREPGRGDHELRLDRAQRTRAVADECLEDRGVVFVLQERRYLRAGDVA